MVINEGPDVVLITRYSVAFRRATATVEGYNGSTPTAVTSRGRNEGAFLTQRGNSAATPRNRSRVCQSLVAAQSYQNDCLKADATANSMAMDVKVKIAKYKKTTRSRLDETYVLRATICVASCYTSRFRIPAFTHHPFAVQSVYICDSLPCVCLSVCV